ncbi:MAG: TonB-dependent receptor [Holophagales bacterium]|nr:TonB-dependent receptor [Holophagales bacterium]MYD22232.1 TonB-dependent receptor [Holophagales bacterium]MYI33366.1 TonB-dependent receptor [Holophagales bacterium]
MRNLVGWIRSVGLVALAFALCATGAWAQATGQLSGFVTDAEGGALPGVSVTVTNVDTNQSRLVMTGQDGYFAAPLLAPGDYNVTAALEGFVQLSREGVRVTAAETARIAMELSVGEFSETMTVTGETPLIETSNATLGVVVDEAKIVQLPLNGRNFTQLGTLIPGVVEPPARLGGARGDADAAIHGFGAVTAGFAVNGVRNQSNNFLLDGAANNDTFNTGFVVRPPPDAIEEFKILTHSYTAEFGRNAGSIVNVVTKSGGNSLQGSIWEFNRDDSLESRNYFSPPDQEKPTLAQDQFGGTIGGPLVTDRLFGFGYYEGFRNTRGTTQNIAVMSAAERMGDFSGGGTIIDPMTGEPFPGNVIPADRLSPIATRVISEFMPLPNVGSRYIVSPDVTDDRDQFGLRLDFRIADSQNVLVRALRSTSDRFEPPTVRPIGNTAASTLEDYMVSHTATVGSNVFNQVRVMSSAIDAEPVVTSGLTNSDYGINLPNINDLAVGLPQFSISGFPSMGDRNQPFVKRENEVEQFTEDLTILRGRHTIKAGIDYRNEKMFIGFINRPNGDFVFRGTHTGSAAADFLLGLPALFRTAVPGADSINEGDGSLYAAYIQDEFRLSPRLTLNLGLRYELAEPFEDTGDALNSFRPGQQSTRFPDAPTGLVYPGDAGVPAGTYDTDSNNFAPRLAMVWDPEGNGRSSLRLGWGLFHDSLPGQGDFFQNSVLAPPFNPLVQLNSPPTVMTLADPLANLTGGPTRFPPGIIFIGWGSEFTTPNYQHYNLTYQRQLGQNIGLEVGWVGSRGRNLPIFMEVNPRVVEPGQTTLGPRLYPAFSLVRPTFTVAKSWYDAFQASVRMRPTRGLNFLFSYTYGEAEDHVSGLNIGGEERPIVPVDLARRTSIDQALERERGPALFDVEHRLVLSFGYDLPSLEGRSGFVRGVFGNWQLNGILQYQTGYPFPIRVRGDDIRGLTSRPDQVCDPNSGAPGTVEKWFNTECFVFRTLAETGERRGNAGRNPIRGPDFERVDLSLIKHIPFGGGDRSLQLRVEAFNVFDRVNFAQPGNRIGDRNYGVITATNGDGRIVQLGIKYSF